MMLSQPVPFDADLAQYEKQAGDLISGHRSADPAALRFVRQYHPAFRSRSEPDTRNASISVRDAQLCVARFYQFANWADLTQYVAAVYRESLSVWQFEAAAEAIVQGDLAALTRLLRVNPDLIHKRSMRTHGAMLIHYLGANGVETYRQQSPRNAVAIAQQLLEAGAEVDALADMYGEDTTLGLVATSVPPCRAGVQIPLIEALAAHGATLDGVPNRWPPLMAALANGRLQAAQTLARMGARVDCVVAAAGIGRLDLVRQFFSPSGKLKPVSPDVPIWGIPAQPNAQLESAFFYACQYGHIDVADFLLRQGVQLNVQDNAGQTGLHHAVIGNQLHVVDWLLERRAALDIRNMYGGTALGQALWCAGNSDSETEYIPLIETLLNAGAEIEPDTLTWLRQQDTTHVQRLTDVLRLHGATL
ncbi:ankyrin repeat domain-containing protein [Spirosoma koreense]